MADYITLKEAAKISGYSPDYLGQLIRKGKLDGKQIYLNVAWVTTEKALKEYLESNKVTVRKSDFGMMFTGRLRRWFVEHGDADDIMLFARRVIYALIGVIVALCIILICALISNALGGIKLL